MIRCVVFAVVVLVATTPVYVYVEPGWRGLVVRLASALVLGVTVLQLRRRLADGLENRGVSALDAARAGREPEPAVPYHFRHLVVDVRTALRSRRSFERVLWPRLVALAVRPLVHPPLRPGRGPSLARLRDVIADLEKQR